MEQKNTYKLIEGQFNPADARSILFTLVNSKINFHSMESFGITVRTSGDISFHEKRIKELTQTNIDIKKLIDFAEEKKLNVIINGNIDIKLVDNQTEVSELLDGEH